MALKLILLALVGIAVDICFIRAELTGKMGLATVLKGTASGFFVVFGALGYGANATPFGKLILIGLVLGMVGDILLNLRNQFQGGMSMKVFALGVLAFLAGHILYIAALIRACTSMVLLAAVMTAVVSFLAIPPLMKRITAPSQGLKLFGYVYLVIVIAMFSCAVGVLVNLGMAAVNLVFVLGAFLFVISDFIMIYYTFGNKIPVLRVTNLLCYYVGQLLIGLCIALV